MSTSWTLSFGIHRGTLMSRDVGRIEGLESLEACKTRLEEKERFLRQGGYVIWFATAIAPDGAKHKIHNGNPYA